MQKIKIERITKVNSPYTLLQQRLQYINRNPERDWLIFTENVPQWPIELISPKLKKHLVTDYGPCNGYDGLIDVISKRENSFYKINIQSENVLVTNGALHGLSLIFRSYFQSGATVLCQAPVLASTAELLTRHGYKIIYFSTKGGEIDIERLRTACLEDVRLIYVNSPHNPTGDVLLKDSIEELVRLAIEKKIGLIFDSVYDSFVFKETPVYTPLSFIDNWDHLYVVNSMSKNYGSPGLRIGWIISDNENVYRLAGLLEEETIAVCGIAQEQAQCLLEFGNSELVCAVKKNKSTIQKYLKDLEKIEYNQPDGGTQFFIKVALEDIDLFADYMLVNYGLVITTSSNYVGIEGSYLRIPMVYPFDISKRALELLSRGLDDFIAE